MGRATDLHKIGHDEQYINISAMQKSDEQLLLILKEHLDDILENTYNTLISEA